MRRILLFLAFLTAIYPAFSQKVQIDGLYYNLNSSAQTATVTYYNLNNNSSYVTGTLTIPVTVNYQGSDYSVTSIGESAFRDCSGLTSVVIPNSVKNISNYAFNGCTAIKSLKFEDGENSIYLGFNDEYPGYNNGKGLFYDCPLETLYLGRNLSYITYNYYGYSPFFNIKTLKEVTISNSVTSIGESAFRDCSGLTSVVIPNSVTYIGAWAFEGCGGLLKSAYPDNLSNPFKNGFSISYPAKNSYFEDGFIFSSDKNILYFIPLNFEGHFAIPNSVTSIGESAFASCSSLTSVEIGNSVTSIGNQAFMDCTGLTSMTIPNSVTSIGNSAFSGCSGLTSVTIPNSVTSIGESAFSGSHIEKLSINCPNIGSWFSNISTLRELSIGNSVTSIGNSAFSGCSGLTSVTIPNSVNSIGNSAFSGCSSLTSVTISNSVTSISQSTFAKCSSLTSVTIPNSVTSIGWSAFNGCSGLTSVEIGNSVTSIGNQAFMDCTGLTSVTIPNSVTSIGRSTFEGCSSLTSVEIGNSVTSTGDRAFFNCPIEKLSIDCPNIGTWFSEIKSLKELTIGNSVTSIGDGAFNGCTGLKNLILEDGDNILELGCNYQASYSGLGRGLFYDCPLETIYLGRTLSYPSHQSYGYSPFYNKKSLKELTIGISVTSISNLTFSGCPLTQINIENPTPPSFYNVFSSYTEDAILIIPDNTILAYLDTGWRNFLTIEEENGSKAYTMNDGVFRYRFIESIEEAWLKPDKSYKSMTSVSIPDRVVGDLNGSDAFYQVTAIESAAFKDCSNITQLKLPSNLVEIGSEAFYGCNSLTKINFPNSVTSIGNSAFSGCSRLTSVNSSDLETWCEIDFGNATANPLYYAENLSLNNETIISLSIPSTITEIKNYAFYNCISITGDLQIPNFIRTIGTEAFANIKFENCIIDDAIENLELTGENKINAKNLYLGRTVNGPLSFSGLDSLEVSGFVESIPSNCFSNNPLTSAIINPGSGIVIEDGAFKGCSSLAEITLPEDIAEIGANAFSGTGLKNVTIPNGTIGANTFASCNLDNIIIGAGVESIGEKAFDGSNALKGVYATPTTPPAAENNTFSYYEAQLYVPEEAIDTYYNNPRCWYRFSGKPLVMPENIVLEGPADITGEPGETFQLTATIIPSNVTLDRVLWRSTNPAVATVDNNGLVTIHNFQDNGRFKAAGSNGYCEIIASTLYEDSPVAVVKIEALAAAIEYVNSDDLNSGMPNGRYANDIYTLQGVCLKHNATQSDIDALAPGMYIFGGKKVIVKK